MPLTIRILTYREESNAREETENKASIYTMFCELSLVACAECIKNDHIVGRKILTSSHVMDEAKKCLTIPKATRVLCV